ncbi:MAG TPA: type II toxin-antitoxin system VapC family toxin [Microlunatus sp.]
MIVVDASVLAPALVDEGGAGARARERLTGERLAAPELIDLELTSVLRNLTRAKKLTVRRAQDALDDLGDLPLERAGHRHLIRRCWELRENLTAYDATYVALAELLSVSLITADLRLAKAPRSRCEIELMTL